MPEIKEEAEPPEAGGLICRLHLCRFFMHADGAASCACLLVESQPKHGSRPSAMGEWLQMADLLVGWLADLLVSLTAANSCQQPFDRSCFPFPFDQSPYAQMQGRRQVQVQPSNQVTRGPQ